MNVWNSGAWWKVCFNWITFRHLDGDIFIARGDAANWYPKRSRTPLKKLKHHWSWFCYSQLYSFMTWCRKVAILLIHGMMAEFKPVRNGIRNFLGGHIKSAEPVAALKKGLRILFHPYWWWLSWSIVAKIEDGAWNSNVWAVSIPFSRSRLAHWGCIYAIPSHAKSDP